MEDGRWNIIGMMRMRYLNTESTDVLEYNLSQLEEATKNRTEYKAPKTEEELEDFKNQSIARRRAAQPGSGAGTCGDRLKLTNAYLF